MSYPCIHFDLYPLRDSDYYHEFIIKDALGVAVNLTGKTVSGTVREYIDSAKLMSSTFSIVDAALGKISISLTASTHLSKTRYFYEIFLLGTTTKDKIVMGQLLVE